tara:strand:- start:598 stop:876 length:279 start_codon:yes stop_codon:yes gene_type:complete
MISGSSTVPIAAVTPKKKANRHVYYHVFQIHYGPHDKRGWVDEMLSEDWGEVHKLKKECENLYPASYGWEFRIIQRRLAIKTIKKEKGTTDG